MFTKSSDTSYSNYEGSFIVLYYEKNIKLSYRSIFGIMLGCISIILISLDTHYDKEK